MQTTEKLWIPTCEMPQATVQNSGPEQYFAWVPQAAELQLESSLDAYPLTTKNLTCGTIVLSVDRL